MIRLIDTFPSAANSPVVYRDKKSIISLAGRLILALNTVVVVVTLLAGGWYYFDATQKARERIETKAQQVGIYLKGALSLPLWELDDQAVKMIGKTLMEDRDLSSVSIQDSEGNTIFTQNRENGEIALTHNVIIEHGNNVVGNVQVSYSEEQLRTQTEKLLWANITIVVALLVAISLSTIFLINWLLRRPIEQLINVAKSFGQGPHPEARDLSKSYREFLPLLNVLSEMEEQIKQQISQIAESEERFHRMFQEHNAVMLLIDPATQEIVDANEAASKYYGYPKEQLISMKITQINTSSVHEVKTAIQQVEEGQRDHYEFKHSLANGETRHVDVYSSPIIIDGHTLLFSIIHDVTERKKAEEGLAHYRENLESLVEEQTSQLNKAHSELLQKERLATLGQVTATVSHELRNPLATIKTALFSIDDCLDRNEPIQATRPLELAERSIDRCVAIIEELNSYARVKKLNITDTPLDQWLKMVVDEQDIPESIECDLRLSHGILASFDQEKLRQVVVNLIGNAIHALQDKNSTGNLLEIATRCMGTQYEISIRDNGVGMSKQNKEKIFEPLFSTKGFGVGLGMTIVKNIVNQHHGEISIESEEGKGTKVRLCFPLNPPPG